MPLRLRIAKADLPIVFAAEPYTRIPIYRDEQIEIVVICFASGQTSSVHDHQGSNCVIRVVRGKVMECLFTRIGETASHGFHQYLHAGEISGLDGQADPSVQQPGPRRHGVAQLLFAAI